MHPSKSTPSPCNDPPTIVLASGSPYRAALLRKILTKFRCEPANIDETALPNESALVLAERLAAGKAQRVATDAPVNTVVIGSDQVALLTDHNNQPHMLGKPGCFELALSQLKRCSGQRVEFISAVAIIDNRNQTTLTFNDTFTIKFRELDENLITQYLHREQPYDCAGSIKTEAMGIALIEAFIGNDPNTLIGLPLIKLIDHLRLLGIQPFEH